MPARSYKTHKKGSSSQGSARLCVWWQDCHPNQFGAADVRSIISHSCLALVSLELWYNFSILRLTAAGAFPPPIASSPSPLSPPTRLTPVASANTVVDAPTRGVDNSSAMFTTPDHEGKIAWAAEPPSQAAAGYLEVDGVELGETNVDRPNSDRQVRRRYTIRKITRRDLGGH